jgi:hypothetical protein
VNSRLAWSILVTVIHQETPTVASPKDVYLPEVLFQMQRVGNSLRVIAIDPTTGIEVVMVAPHNGAIEGVKRIAARKLAYVIARKREKSTGKNSGRK